MVANGTTPTPVGVTVDVVRFIVMKGARALPYTLSPERSIEAVGDTAGGSMNAKKSRDASGARLIAGKRKVMCRAELWPIPVWPNHGAPFHAHAGLSRRVPLGAYFQHRTSV